MKKIFASTVIALLLLIVLASTTFAATEKEFRLKGSLEASQTVQVVFPTAYINLTGTGVASHVGLFTFQLQAELNIPTATGAGSSRLVAADGSTLFMEGSGHGTPTDVPGVVLIVDTFTITGGTGRFAGASGNVIVERVLNQATGVSSGTISGIIILP
jgi:hypothetical protein